jgi:uncharacterized protein
MLRYPAVEGHGVRKNLGLALLLLVTFAVAWWLLVPRTAPHVRPIVMHTEQPSPEATQASPSPLPAASATASPQAVPTVTLSPAPPAHHGARLALIVDDCGQWIDTERGFVALDVPLTLSVLPDVHYTATIAREAAAAGKGVMLHLPMETVSGLNPGPGKVTTEMSDSEIVSQVESDLEQVPNAAGVNNHEGSKASADSRVMHDVIGVLAKRGNLFFIDSKTSAASVGEQVALAQGVPAASRDVFLDNEESVDYTVAQLREAAAIAKRNGSAIAIGHPRETTLEAVKLMIPELESSGIQFVLAGDVVSNSLR